MKNNFLMIIRKSYLEGLNKEFINIKFKIEKNILIIRM